jgi:hypothetical protein
MSAGLRLVFAERITQMGYQDAEFANRVDVRIVKKNLGSGVKALLALPSKFLTSGYLVSW